MLIQTDQGLFRIRFRHRPGTKVQMVTDCLVQMQDHDFPYEGIAMCSKKDNFCKETGRKIALARAMKPFGRELRTKIWEAYFKRGE